MTRQLPVAPVIERAATHRIAPTSKRIAVEVLACGSPDRGDDGAPIAAAALLRDGLPDDVAIRVVGQLAIDDLLAIPADAGVVIVDAATGIRPGRIVDLPVGGLVHAVGGPKPRSSHALTFPEVIGLSMLIRGHPVRGRIVAIGGLEFGLGSAFSVPVALALPAFVAAIRKAIVSASGEAD